MAGAWNFIHGHSGRIENLEQVKELTTKGWGLSFYQTAGTENWVHFALPSNSQFGWRIDFLELQFTAGENAKVTQVHLWDGAIQFWEGALDTQTGAVDVVLDLGGEWEVHRALGVSLKIETDPAGDGHFMFYSVGANFRQ